MKYLLKFDYIRFAEWLAEDTNNDDAAMRSLKRKFEELRDDTRVSYMDAREQLFQEYVDCLPVDA